MKESFSFISMNATQYHSSAVFETLWPTTKTPGEVRSDAKVRMSDTNGFNSYLQATCAFGAVVGCIWGCKGGWSEGCPNGVADGIVCSAIGGVVGAFAGTMVGPFLPAIFVGALLHKCGV